MSEKQTEAYRLALKLDSLSSAKKPYPNGVCGQTVGCESYLLIANGFAFSCLDEAARKLLDLEEAKEELIKALQEAVDLIEALDGYDNSCDPKNDITSLKEAITKHGGE